MAKKQEVQANFEETMKELDKEYGKGSVIELGRKLEGEYNVVSTGSIDFDNALGIGGFTVGRLYELKGWEGTGKSTICGHLAANFQRKYPDRKVIYIDGEHALDKTYFNALGVDTDRMFIAQPDYGEMGFNIMEKLIDTGEVSLCIVDSNTSLLPKKLIDGEAGDGALGLHARLNSAEWPKIKNKLIKNKTCVIAISQFREKIGIMFGSPVCTNGGHALKFYSDVIIEVSKQLLKADDEAYGSKTKIKITKNKMSPPFVSASFAILWGKGIDKIGEIITKGGELEVFKKWGDSITFPEGEKYTIQEFRQLLEDNDEFMEKIRNSIMQKLKEACQNIE